MANPTATIYPPYHAFDSLIQRGTRASQPAATAVTPGTLFCVTDEGAQVERSNGSVWQLYGPTAGGVGGGMDLNYLGSYTAGTYDDGDIVIGSDGIAYLCVVDGTTTPPEPWPGGGTAGLIADAQYWVSTAHGSLTAERDFGAMASGFVFSTVAAGVSTPSTLTVTQTQTELGLGTMAYQNADAVAITGGTIHTISDLTVSGNVLVSGNINANGIGATLFFGDGANLTNLNASQLTHGTVGTARLGTGTANSGTYLRGDQTWQSIQGLVFPSGLIVLSLTPCPIGWTRVGWDGLFLRVGPTAGEQGGSSDHTHGSHSHGAGTYQAAAHNHGGSVTVSMSGTTAGAGGHSHTASLSGAFANTTSGSGHVFTLEYDHGGSSVQLNTSNHFHNTGSGITVSGTTDSVADHSHAFSASGGGGIATNAPAVTGESDAATIPAASNLPPYISVFLCQKN